MSYITGTPKKPVDRSLSEIDRPLQNKAIDGYFSVARSQKGPGTDLGRWPDLELPRARSSRLRCPSGRASMRSSCVSTYTCTYMNIYVYIYIYVFLSASLPSLYSLVYIYIYFYSFVISYIFLHYIYIYIYIYTCVHMSCCYHHYYAISGKPRGHGFHIGTPAEGIA